MTGPYRCPNCKTNRTRFNRILQQPEAVKLDPKTGDVVESYTNSTPDPFHILYKGPEYRIQCATCGLIEEEKTFLKFGENDY